MDFALPDSAVAVREGLTRAVAGFDHDYWSRCDAEHRFPEEAWNALGDGGWLGLVVPEEFGGGGQGLRRLKDQGHRAGKAHQHRDEAGRGRRQAQVTQETHTSSGPGWRIGLAHQDDPGRGRQARHLRS